METLNGFLNKEMWKALISCNPDYDGHFFYAIKTTGVFCRPSCKSKRPKPENVSFYATASEAVEAGYRPCKRCRPDLSLYDPCKQVINDTKEIMKQDFSQQLDLNEIAQKVGVSQFHLHRMFKKKTGDTPRIYLGNVRIEKAKELFVTTNLSITEIGFRTGFQSVSGFYRAFKRETGMTPNRFKRDR